MFDFLEILKVLDDFDVFCVHDGFVYHLTGYHFYSENIVLFDFDRPKPCFYVYMTL